MLRAIGPIELLTVFGILLLLAWWVAQDAAKRGMSGLGWGLGVFLFCIVFLPLYLILRKPLMA